MNRVMRCTVALCLVFLFAIGSSCKHSKGVPVNSVKTWADIPMKASFETPAPAGRNEEGEATLQLMSDNSLKYDFHIHNLSPGDQLTAAHIHIGDAVTGGSVFINLNPNFVGAGASGVVKDLRPGQIDTLLNKQVYINVHSTQAPDGLVRGQMDEQVQFAIDVQLSGNNEVPVVATTATGMAMIRLMSDDTLYSKVTVTGVEANDTLTVSHIHRGVAGVNGPVRIFLASSLADFGIVKTSLLVDSLKNMVKNDPVYVNVHSKRYGGGKIRGQIR